MLATSTKKRLDDCRDILVGKLPDLIAEIEHRLQKKRHLEFINQPIDNRT